MQTIPSSQLSSSTQPDHLSTEEFARRLCIRAQTARAALCRQGHYYGIKPIKGPNGRLLWPADAVDRLLGKQNND
jgi:hypothetical protein